tara:strand:+ start:2441 stop:2722 length:282 start_codon:yes stop_codon:yes gene_type:complete
MLDGQNKGWWSEEKVTNNKSDTVITDGCVTTTHGRVNSSWLYRHRKPPTIGTPDRISNDDWKKHRLNLAKAKIAKRILNLGIRPNSNPERGER